MDPFLKHPLNAYGLPGMEAVKAETSGVVGAGEDDFRLGPRPA